MDSENGPKILVGRGTRLRGIGRDHGSGEIRGGELGLPGGQGLEVLPGGLAQLDGDVQVGVPEVPLLLRDPGERVPAGRTERGQVGDFVGAGCRAVRLAGIVTAAGPGDQGRTTDQAAITSRQRRRFCRTIGPSRSWKKSSVQKRIVRANQTF